MNCELFTYRKLDNTIVMVYLADRRLGTAPERSLQEA